VLRPVGSYPRGRGGRAGGWGGGRGEDLKVGGAAFSGH
jgi:hypothetical protein